MTSQSSPGGPTGSGEGIAAAGSASEGAAGDHFG